MGKAVQQNELEARQSALIARSRAPAAPPTDPRSDFDTQLMLQLQTGEADAGNILLRRNFDRVARYVGRLIRDPRVIEDLTQDVFVQVLTHAAKFEPTARFSTWLYRIATNVALKHLYAPYERRKLKDKTEHDFEMAAGPDAQPDRKIDLTELRARVAEAVEALPVNQRIALTLCEYEGLSYEQIAPVLDVTVEAVRALLSRARATLREQLAGLA